MTFLADIVKLNTPGQGGLSRPVGVPLSWSWYAGALRIIVSPPPGFVALTGWAIVYPKAGVPYQALGTVEIANMRTWARKRDTKVWTIVQDQTNPAHAIGGGVYTATVQGVGKIPGFTVQANRNVSMQPPESGFCHHWWINPRGDYAAGSVDYAYVELSIRCSDARLQAIAQVGLDWWKDGSVGWVSDFSNNPGAGMTNWVDLTTSWQTIGFFTAPIPEFSSSSFALPPTLLSAASPPPPTPPPTPLIKSLIILDGANELCRIPAAVDGTFKLTVKTS